MKTETIEELKAELVRHKELLEFYSAGVQSRDNAIVKAIERLDTLLPSNPWVRSALCSVLDILKGGLKTEKPTEKPPKVCSDHYESSSAVCLVCGGDELDWEWPMTGEGDEVWHRVTCQDCDANWQDVYTFSGIDNLKKGKE